MLSGKGTGKKQERGEVREWGEPGGPRLLGPSPERRYGHYQPLDLGLALETEEACSTQPSQGPGLLAWL